MKRALPIVLLLLCVVGYGQPSSVEALKAKIKTFKNQKRYGVRYDKFTDVTTAWFRFDLDEGGQRLGGVITFSGDYQNPTHYVVYEDRGRYWKHLEHRQLYALIDGERRYLGEGDRESKISHYYYRSDVSVRERLTFRLDSDVFEKIGKARTVEFKVGSKQIAIKDEHRQAFRDLESLLNP